MRGSSAADDDVVAAAVCVGAEVAAGAVVAAGVVDAGAVVDFFFGCLGALGAVSGSWYCSSPAPWANAAPGATASSSDAAMVVKARRGIEPLVADGSRGAMVTLRAWLSHAGWR